MCISGVSTVGPSGACAPLTFSLLINSINQLLTFLVAVIRIHMHNLEVVHVADWTHAIDLHNYGHTT